MEESGQAARALRTLARAEEMAEQMIAAAAAEARARARVDAQEIIATAQAERGREESELHLHRQPELGALVMEAQHLRVEIDRISHLDRQYHGALQALLAEQQRLLEQRTPRASAATGEPPATEDLRPAA
jgi:hypothetical protein